MMCHRCGGMMIYEKFYSDGEHFFGWRCVICGEIVDGVILGNRRYSATLCPKVHKGSFLSREWLP